MIKNYILLIIISFLLTGCNGETLDNSRTDRMNKETVEKTSYHEGDTSQVVPEKRKVDFWDEQFGYQITGKSKVYIADVQDGQDGATQLPGVDYYNGFGIKDIVEANIPEKVVNNNITYTVVGIGLHSFAGCNNVKSINMPDTIRYVEESAFDSCYQVENIKLSSNLEYIGTHSFSLSRVSEFKLPNSLKILEVSSLSFNILTEIVIPENVEVMGDLVFNSCTNLENVTILATEMEMGKHIFNECDNLKKVYVPKESLDYYKECFKEYDFEVLSLE